jgi:hypothetical protein
MASSFPAGKDDAPQYCDKLKRKKGKKGKKG